MTKMPKALEVVCPICNAKIGERCASLVDARHYLEISHVARQEVARKETR